MKFTFKTVFKKYSDTLFSTIQHFRIAPTHVSYVNSQKNVIFLNFRKVPSTVITKNFRRFCQNDIDNVMFIGL